MIKIDVNQLLSVGIELSREKDYGKLLETILVAAMDITNCDAGTLYINQNESLVFQIMITKSMGVFKNGAYEPIELPPVPFEQRFVSARAAIDRRLINISDVRTCGEYDFTGTLRYDAATGYRTESCLVVPMENDYGEIIGVMQLINALDENGATIAFDREYEQVILSLGAQAAICLTNMNYSNEITGMFDSFIRVMSTAIDARSPYNANHTKNMVAYGEKFLDWLRDTGNEWQLDDATRRQFLMSVWLHDVGKLVTPLEVMDKDSRLGDRLQAVQNRFNVLLLRNKIDSLEGRISEAEFSDNESFYTDALALICESNTAGFLPEDKIERIAKIADRTYADENGELQPCLTPEELVSLSVMKGTLTAEERGIMESHVTMTARMLGEMDFSKHHKNVPVWAASHHEFLNGRGYPNHLEGDEIPREVRLLTILDVFDALTARDRPYKAGMPAEKAFSILEAMVRDGQVDAKLLELFRESGAWEAAAGDGA